MKLPRNAQIWFPGYVKSRWRDAFRRPPAGAGRVWVAIADHFEPYFAKPTDEIARQRMALWVRHWPEIAARHRDSAGNRPVYTFYYPQEEYRPEFLDMLAKMTRDGIGDVEVHIHHDGEGEQNFVERMSGFIETLHRRHGLLRKHQGRVVFGFIHGNWALDNSRPDGRWCGLNNEITLLRDLGCYADFTMPSGASPTQGRILNTIYWATDDPAKPRSYDRGVPVVPGKPGSGDLLMVPGPMCIRWTERMVPRLETGEIAAYDLPNAYRVKRWIDVAPRIGNDLFIKLYTHGTQERNSTPLLLRGALDDTYRLVAEQCRKRGYEYRFVSTWDMRLAIDRAVAGNPSASSVKS